MPGPHTQQDAPDDRVPKDYDIGLTSVSDSQAMVDAVVAGGELPDEGQRVVQKAPARKQTDFEGNPVEEDSADEGDAPKKPAKGDDAAAGDETVDTGKAKKAVAKSESEATAEGDEPPPKKKSQWQINAERKQKRIAQFEERIGNARKELGELEEEIRRKRGELGAAPDDRRSRRAAEPPARTSASPTDAGEDFRFPAEEDWLALPAHANKSHEDYLDARLDARSDWRRGREARAAAKVAADTAHAQALETFQSRATAFRAEHADYDDVLAAATWPGRKDDPTKQAVETAVIDDEQGPALLYYLAHHPEEVTRIAGLTPIKATKAIGTLAEKLADGRITLAPADDDADDDPDDDADDSDDDDVDGDDTDLDAAAPARRPARGTPPKRTDAPAPARRARGSGGGQPSLDDLDTDAFIRRRNDEEAERNRRTGRF